MNNPLLSILICTLPKRKEMFDALMKDLILQMPIEPPEDIQILTDDSEFDSIGEKRNRLLEKAQGKYLCFVDDDDSVSENYIKLLIEAAKSDQDCASLKGEITIDDGDPEIFEHSLIYDKWKTNPEESAIRYERFPNHLNMIRSDIAKQFKFPEKNHGEDFDWSTELHKSGLLKTEHYIPEVIYYYNYITNK